MNTSWLKAITDPLGLAGYALSLLFGVVTYTVKQRKPRNSWIAPAGFILAAACILGGIGLAYQRQITSFSAPATQTPQTPAEQQMDLHDIHQKATCGTAVAGVQGNVTINGSSQNCQQAPR
jgi:hypothetical protein